MAYSYSDGFFNSKAIPTTDNCSTTAIYGTDKLKLDTRMHVSC